MVFSFTITGYIQWGNKKVAYGTYTNTGSTTGGHINTGLETCELICLQPKGTSVIATVNTINENLIYDGESVTIVTAAGEDGQWIAWGI